MKWFVALFQIYGRKVVVGRALREPGLVSVSLNQIFRVLYLKKMCHLTLSCKTYFTLILGRIL